MYIYLFSVFYLLFSFKVVWQIVAILRVSILPCAIWFKPFLIYARSLPIVSSKSLTWFHLGNNSSTTNVEMIFLPCVSYYRWYVEKFHDKLITPSIIWWALKLGASFSAEELFFRTMYAERIWFIYLSELRSGIACTESQGAAEGKRKPLFTFSASVPPERISGETF